VSEDVAVKLHKVLHNDGNVSVDVSISATASAPADCTATPHPANPVSANLPVSANVAIDETWTIHCGARSQHVFFFDNQISTEDPGVDDPDLGNNFASTQLVVNVWAQADLNMLEQYVEDPPAEVPVGQDVPITVVTVIQNGGPFGPVDAVAETIVTFPNECQARDHTERIRDLPVGVSSTVKAPVTIRCDEPGQHTFSFDNTIRVNQQHVRDPNAENDTVHTELTVTAS
jgi:hypothetical protein